MERAKGFGMGRTVQGYPVVGETQGAARLRAEDARVAEMRAGALPPERCGSDMIAQPGAGARIIFSPMGMIPDGRDGWKREHVGHRGRDAARAADAFDRMQAAEDRVAKRRGRDPVELFTLVELGAGRRYATLVERHNAAGVRCSSIEAQRGQGGGGGGFMDALIDEGRQIQRLRRAVGDDMAMGLRRIRPSVRGTRAGITDRALVDGVCVGGLTVSEVLERHGWATSHRLREAARAALKAALRRMVMA